MVGAQEPTPTLCTDFYGCQTAVAQHDLTLTAAPTQTPSASVTASSTPGGFGLFPTDALVGTPGINYGCPEEAFETDNLEPGWAFVCSACVNAVRPTRTPGMLSYSAIPTVEIPTYPPLGSATVTGTLTATSTATATDTPTVTYTPSVTPTPGPWVHVLDFTMFEYYYGQFSGFWVSGEATENALALWTYGLGYGTTGGDDNHRRTATIAILPIGGDIHITAMQIHSSVPGTLFSYYSLWPLEGSYFFYAESAPSTADYYAAYTGSELTEYVMLGEYEPLGETYLGYIERVTVWGDGPDPFVDVPTATPGAGTPTVTPVPVTPTVTVTLPGENTQTPTSAYYFPPGVVSMNCSVPKYAPTDFTPAGAEITLSGNVTCLTVAPRISVGFSLVNRIIELLSGDPVTIPDLEVPWVELCLEGIRAEVTIWGLVIQVQDLMAAGIAIYLFRIAMRG